MKIYTKTGDAGMTALIGGERVCKDDIRVEAYGTVDELTAFIAYLRDHMDSEHMAIEEHKEDLRSILLSLMKVQALLAVCEESVNKVKDIYDEEIDFLESRIDYMSSQLDNITHFTIPGGDPLISLTHICRTICRRAERAAVKSSHEYPVSEKALVYLNRLSDYLYQLGRKLTDEIGAKEEYWEPGN